MKLLLAAAALMAGVSAKPGTIRIDSAKGEFSSIVRHIGIRSFEFCDSLRGLTGLVG